MIRAMIVDDELAAVGNLADLLLELGNVETIGEFTNPFEALERVSSLDVDVAFLDIEMPGIDGLDLAGRFLELNRRIQVVFVTAYQEYAVEAFDLHALDYLLKPVTKKRLQKTLQRLSDRKELRNRLNNSKLCVKCFNKFKVESEEGIPVKWRTSKTEELFAYLVDRGGDEASKELIVELLWGHMDEKRALANFSTCLYNLRKTLAGLGFPNLVINDGGMLKLDMNQISTDVQKFEKCVSQVEQGNIVNWQEVRKILENYGEGYLALNYYEWAEHKRRMLEEDFMKLIVQAAEREAAMNREQKAAELLKLGLQKDPLCQPLNFALLKLYVQMRDGVAAMKHFQDYKKRLAIELGIEPEEEMEQLIKAVTGELKG